MDAWVCDMKEMRATALIMVVLSLVGCQSQDSVKQKAKSADTSLVVAGKNADAYLAALKIIGIPEGARAAKQEAWSPVDRPPILQDYTKLYEGIFDTDVPTIKGYKRLVQARIQSQDRTPLETNYVLVSYQDRKSGQWRVYNFLELRSSIEEEVDSWKEELGNPKESKHQFDYGHYADWLMIAGKLEEAKQASEKAISLNTANPDPIFESATRCNERLRIIKAIVEGN